MNTEETILIVEDDVSLMQGLTHNLKFDGYRVLQATDGQAALVLAKRHRPALIVLDIMLPGLNGLDVLRMLRADGFEMPVIILSALGMQSDKVQGLKAGADDYVTKPFGLSELLARIDSSLRRTRKAASAPIRYGDVVVDVDNRMVTKSGETVRLTSREFDLLMLLLNHPGRVFSRREILAQTWSNDYEGTDRTVDNFVRSLRKKLEDDPAAPDHLLTEHGLGYRFDPQRQKRAQSQGSGG